MKYKWLQNISVLLLLGAVVTVGAIATLGYVWYTYPDAINNLFYTPTPSMVYYPGPEISVSGKLNSVSTATNSLSNGMVHTPGSAISVSGKSNSVLTATNSLSGSPVVYITMEFTSTPTPTLIGTISETQTGNTSVPATNTPISTPTKTRAPTNAPPKPTATPKPTSNPGPTSTPKPTSPPEPTSPPQPTSEPSPDNVYYVSPNGNDNNPGTLDAPWKTLAKANAAAKAGDTIIFRKGVYEGPLSPQHSGNAGAWIVFKAYPGETPVIVSDNDGISIRKLRISNLSYEDLPSYIEVNGFVIDGANVKGIRIEHAHHIRIVNNIIRNNASAGISTNNGIDHIVIRNNKIYGNSNVAAPCSSAISIWNAGCLFPSGSGEGCLVMNDGSSGYHIEIKNNIIYDNRNDDSACAAGGRPSDGNGVIMDNNGVLTPRTLIENNVIFHNGGMCVNILNSGNINVFHNTCYHNVETPRLTDNGNAEFVVSNHSFEDAKGAVVNVNFRNNIVYGNGSATLLRVWANPNQGWNPQYTADYNLYFNGLLNGNFQTGEHDLINVDPLFVFPSLDPAKANFSLQPNSPAIGAGENGETMGAFLGN